MRSCLVPDCPALVESGYCQEHKGYRRPHAAARGYGWTYRKARAYVLARDPICTTCHAQRSTVAHHDPLYAEIKRHDVRLMFGKCRECHEREHGRLK